MHIVPTKQTKKAVRNKSFIYFKCIMTRGCESQDTPKLRLFRELHSPDVLAGDNFSLPHKLRRNSQPVLCLRVCFNLSGFSFFFPSRLFVVFGGVNLQVAFFYLQFFFNTLIKRKKICEHKKFN